MSEIEEIRKALEKCDEGMGSVEREIFDDYFDNNSVQWLRTLLEENEQLRDGYTIAEELSKQVSGLLEENQRLTAFCKEWAGEEDKFQDFGGWDRIEKMKAEIERLTTELAEEKRHAETEREQANKWLEENGRLRAELDKSDREVISKGRELHELRTELAEKDKTLEWIRDAGTDYQSIHKAREVLAHYKKGDTTDASKDE